MWVVPWNDVHIKSHDWKQKPIDCYDDLEWEGFEMYEPFGLNGFVAIASVSITKKFR